VPFSLSNDRVDLALAADADGVHIGRGHPDCRRSTATRSPRLVSTTNPEEMGIQEGADYIGGQFTNTDKEVRRQLADYVATLPSILPSPWFCDQGELM